METARPQRRAENLQSALVDDLFASLTIQDTIAAPLADAPNQNPGYEVEKLEFKYYSPPKAWKSSNVNRIAVFAALVRWPVTNPDFSSEDLPTWIYSCLDLAFPGLSSTVLSQDPNVDATKVVLNNEFVDGKRPDGTVAEGWQDDLPGLVIDIACESAEWLHIIGALTTLLFVLGKTPTQANFSAFTVNRPRAIAGQMGIELDQSSPMSAARLPKFEHFCMFGGYFNVNLVQRQGLARVLIGWSKMRTLTADQAVVVAQILLWKNAGLTHMNMVHDFLRNFGRAVAGINSLKTEIQVFVNMYHHYRRSNDSDKDYLRVIDGNRAQLGRSREYTNLLNLARSLAAAIDPRFNQYAAALGESPFKQEFIEKCEELNYSLPHKYIDATQDGETGGGVVRTQ